MRFGDADVTVQVLGNVADFDEATDQVFVALEDNDCARAAKHLRTAENEAVADREKRNVAMLKRQVAKSCPMHVDGVPVEGVTFVLGTIGLVAGVWWLIHQFRQPWGPKSLDMKL